MIKLPTKKDIIVCYTISLTFIPLGIVPIIQYFCHKRNFPTFFSSSFFIIVLSGLFLLTGLTLFIVSSIDLIKLITLNNLRKNSTNEAVLKYKTKFEKYIKLKNNLLIATIPLVLLLGLVGLLIYQIKKSSNLFTILILLLPIIFLVFIFVGILYQAIKNKNN